MPAFRCATCHRPTSTHKDNRVRCGVCSSETFHRLSPERYELTRKDEIFLRALLIVADITPPAMASGAE